MTKWIAGGMLLAAGLGGALWLWSMFKQDVCLDRGGRWSAAEQTCIWSRESSVQNSSE